MNTKHVLTLALLISFCVPMWAVGQEAADARLATLKAQAAALQKQLAEIDAAIKDAESATAEDEGVPELVPMMAGFQQPPAPVPEVLPVLIEDNKQGEEEGIGDRNLGAPPRKTTAQLGDAKKQELEQLAQGLESLRKKTPNFAGVCNAIANAIDDNLAFFDDDPNPDPSGLNTVLKAAIKAQMDSQIPTDDGLHDEWVERYDGMVKIVEEGPKPPTSGADWIDLYQGASAALKVAAKTKPKASSILHPEAQAEKEQTPAGFGLADAFAPEQFIDGVVAGMDEFNLTKDPYFEATCRAIIAELEKLRQEVKDDLDTMSGQAYLKKLREAYANALRSDNRFSTTMQKLWADAYKKFEIEFVKEGDADDPKTWDNAAVLITAALYKALKIDKSWQEVAKDATPSGAGGVAAQGAGGGTGAGTGGISRHAARSVRRIRSRSAIYRARTQAILDR